jgi:predicted transcriptional regulator
MRLVSDRLLSCGDFDMADAAIPDVTDAELGVLQALWDDGPATIRQLTDRLYSDRMDGGGSTSFYATVQKLLERLEAKGCVTRDRSAMTHRFKARIARDVYIGGQLRAMAERLCGGSLTPLLTHLVRTETLSEADRKALRTLLNQPKPSGNE